MPNIKLIGFTEEQANDLIPKIAEAIRTKTDLAGKAVITHFPGSTCVSVADLSPMPYLAICNTSEDGTVREFEVLTEALKPLGYDIEWWDIKEFFAAPNFERWTTLHQKSG